MFDPLRPLSSASALDQWEAWVRSWFSVLQQPPREGLQRIRAQAATPSLAAVASTGFSDTRAGTGADVKQRGAEASTSLPHVLIFAPHPDDECIVGALPLRLRQEAGWQVTNVAVTLGSRQDRRAERLAELQAACDVLGFGLHLMAPDGFEHIKPEASQASTPLWRQQVKQVADLLRSVRPALVLVPHAGDGIPTHIGVHALVSEALAEAGLSTVVASTEFWATQEAPNLLVETGVRDTAQLVRALSCHHGEIARNPYHLRLPAWMADNVRRGGELLAGPGEAPPSFGFATLYRLTRWVEGRPQRDLPPRQVSCEDAMNAEALFTSA